MIFGNIKTYRSCGMSSEALDKYIEVLKSITPDTQNGSYKLEDGAFYSVGSVSQVPAEEKQYETHKKYIDIQCVIEGTEYMGYADVGALKVTKEYDEGGDYALHDGEGVLLKFNPGDFAVFAPMDAHKPGCGTGTSRKVLIKVPVK